MKKDLGRHRLSEILFYLREKSDLIFLSLRTEVLFTCHFFLQMYSR